MDVRATLKSDEQAVFSLRNLYQQYGYRPFKMSRFEEYDLYVQNKDFLVSDQVITFSDCNGRLLALKPDVTLSIIKNAVDKEGVVQKVYYNENVYRVDRNTHAFKEIMQTGLECVGDLTQLEITEVVLLAAKSLAAIDSVFILDISHMGLISEILAESSLSDAEKEQVIACLHQKNLHELQKLCAAGRCSGETVSKLSALISNSGRPADVLPAIRAVLTSDKELAALEELARMCAVLNAQGLSNMVRIDFSVGSDMKYYSGVVFKGYLEGLPESILSGGQYDKLLRKMGRKGSAVGFAIYLDLLERRKPITENFDVDMILQYPEATDMDMVFAVAEELRKAGSVLITSTLPQDRSYRQRFVLQDGKAVLVDENG